MAEATTNKAGCVWQYTTAIAVLAGDVVQAPDGRAAVVIADAAAGTTATAAYEGIFTLPKTASIVMLDGGKAYWDASASKVHFKQVNDRDYLIGVVVGDTLAASATVAVNLNVVQRTKVDLARDAYASVLVGTAALNGFGYPYREGGALRLNITATSEAQKVDALSLEGFAYTANPIVEFAFRNTGGSGSASDFTLGVANATHASDADSITDSCFIHMDGGTLTIYAECDDGTNETNATTTGVSYVATSVLSSRVECWIDMRDMSSIKFYVDGIAVATGTTFSMAASTATLYLLAHLEKTTGTETAAMIVDWMNARTMEQ